MKRFPNGVEQDFFHQKRVPANHPDYVDEVFVQFPSGHSTVFAIVDNAAALAWVANLGCIELHTWHSRVPAIEQPDYLLIDLDPTSDGQWPFVREIALVVRDVLDGARPALLPEDVRRDGLHILAPIKPDLPFPDVRRFAKAAGAGGRAARRRSGGRDDDVACRRSRRRVRRLRPERPRPDDRGGVLRAADAGRARLGAAPVGRGRSASSRRRSRSRRCPARIAAVGDPMRGMWRNPPSLRPRFARLDLEPPPQRPLSSTTVPKPG